MIEYRNKFMDETKNFKNATIGYFDGVHKGHQILLNKLTKDDVIITFKNHLFSNEIYPLEQKIFLLKEFCPNIIVLDLDKIKNNTKEDFISYLKTFNLEKIIVGEDFKFGTDQEGDAKYLSDYFNLEIIPLLTIDGEKISSTLIREYLKEGKINEANELLTRTYAINDIVVRGHQIGRELGFPTINVFLRESLLLRYGVYRTKITIDDIIYNSITNVGVRPTFNNSNILEETTETFVFDFNQGTYGEFVKVEFLEFVRDEKKFNDKNELVEQIKKDIDYVRGKNEN